MLSEKFKESNKQINKIIEDVIKTEQGEFYGDSIKIEGYSISVSGDPML